MPYLLVFHLYQNYEWSTTYFTAPRSGALLASWADDVATAESYIFGAHVKANRWEYFDGTPPVKVAEGSLNWIGSLGDEALPIKYCALVRENSSPIIKRPSFRYIHGLTKSTVDTGQPSAAYLDRIQTYGNDLDSLGVLDSDGSSVSGATFRSFTMRHKLRRLL